MLVSEIHDNLTRQHYLSLSGLSLYSLLGNLIVIAYALDDIIEREHLLNWVFSYAQDMASSKTHEVNPQLAQAAADFVQLDAAVLDEMLEIVASVAA